MLLAAVFLISFMFSCATANFSPQLILSTCSKTQLEVTVTGAEPGGILYVQGQGQACKQSTAAGVNKHVLDFASCGIGWDEEFKIVIQKRADFQTSLDKQFPVECSLDLNNLRVSNDVQFQGPVDAPPQVKVVTPRATMKLLKNGQDMTGQLIQVSDIIDMVIKLDKEFTDFDVKAIRCQASMVDIIRNGCSVDLDLFPHMSRVRAGWLSAQFSAFRTTSLAGGIVRMPFSCNLQVCVGVCSPTLCSDGYRGYGKRSTERVQPINTKVTEVYEDVKVNSDVYIIDERSSLNTTGHVAMDTRLAVCMSIPAFSVMLVVMILGMLLSFIMMCVVRRKLRSKTDHLKDFQQTYLFVPT